MYDPRLALSLTSLLSLCAGGVVLADASIWQDGADPKPTASQRVEAARRALGWDSVDGDHTLIRVVGDARLLGSDMKQIIMIDERGRFRQDFAGSLPQSGGFDGTTAWSVDWSGTPRVLVMGDRAGAEAMAHLLHGTWALPCAPFIFEMDGDTLAFRHTNGVLTGGIKLDPETSLPASASFDTTTLTFDGFGEHDGFRFPTSVQILAGAAAQSWATRELKRSKLSSEELAATFKPELERREDTSFQSGAANELEVRRVPSGHLLVHPLLNGEDHGWFIFDTGAGINCIAEHVLDDSFGESLGTITARGVGGDVASNLHRVSNFALGPITVENQVFMSLDLAFLEEHFGVPVGGILGYELFARSVAEVDMRDGKIALYDPESYELPSSGTWSDAILYGKHPHIEATFEGELAVFKIDTGAADDTVSLHYDFVIEQDLLAGRETERQTSGGVGGTVEGQAGLVRSFVLGGHTFEDFQAIFVTEKKGVFANKYVQGNIGGRLLEPFLMTFDYPHGRLGFTTRK